MAPEKNNLLDHMFDSVRFKSESNISYSEQKEGNIFKNLFLSRRQEVPLLKSQESPPPKKGVVEPLRSS